MRKISKLLALFMAMAAILVIQSCDDDDDPKPAAPIVTAPATVATVQIGTKADVTFTFEAAGGFESSAVTATGGTATIKTDATASAEEGSIVVEFTAGNTAGAGSVTLTITDAQDQSASQTATLNVSLSAPPTVVLSTNAVSGTPGGTVEVTVDFDAPNGASSLAIAGATSTPASPIALSGTADSEVVTLTVPANAVIGSTINVFFTVTDAQSLTSTAALLTISVTDPLIVLEGNITTNMTLDADEKYLIRGKVYVQAPATLTIPAGTVLFGEKDSDGALIINRGAKIDARGTAENPIIMTSQAPKGFRNRGDWGGVVLLGYDYNSNGVSAAIEGISSTGENGVYGPAAAAAVTDDNSGFMQYVRIEYAGIALALDNELNSLTMGSVGSGTTIDHIMISYANDDAYEWFGGSVNHKYLIAYSTNDDDFDTDRGYIGKVQFGLVVRENGIADVSGSKAWESSSNSLASPNTYGGVSRHSMPVFSNITVMGPRLFGPANNTSSNYKAALEINSNSAIKIHNSIITGFVHPAYFATAGSTVTSNVFAAHTNSTPDVVSTGGAANTPASFSTDNTLEGTITNIFGPFTHKTVASAASNNIYGFSALPNIAFQAATSPYLTGAIDLSTDTFFENVAYKGAFGTTAAAGWNYSSAWVNFDPNNADY
jgi:hypothetical protein